jgi:cyclohexa-1,5-dienecarbonyl-CoA hydratase
MEKPDGSLDTISLPGVHLTADGGLRRIDLDRPPLNVLDLATLRSLDEALVRVGEDPEAALLLITGRGKAFCAGVDVADHTPERVDDMIALFHRALERLMALELPVVAAINGAALGGGLELALACDILLARDGARMGQPEIRLGVLPPFAAVVLPRLLGRARALDLCLSGRTFDAAEARGMGLVQHVFPQASFADDAEAYVADVASLSRPVLRLTKRAVVASLDVSLEEALRATERLYLDELMRLADAREGLAAFLEKRQPVWTGA